MGDEMLKSMMKAMRGQLEADAAAGKLAGLALDDLADAMSHPKASAVVTEMMGIEASSVKPDQPAPDFTLPWLPGSEGGETATLTLSEHFGKRPVALVFGSYT